MRRSQPPDGEADVTARVWVMSDLQTANAREAERCLGTAIDDFGDSLDEMDQVWYLGDAVSGTDIERNRAVAERTIELLEPFSIPGRYVMGNHDIDPPRKADVRDMPFYDLASEHPDWRTTESAAEFSFTDTVGGHRVLFLSDHVAPDLSWSVTHGRIRGNEAAYPYEPADYRSALQAANAEGKPLIIAGHNAFPGGNRGADLQRWFQPLPAGTRLHLYGHAHIGDERRMPSESGSDAYRTISFIDHSQVPQVDVASLEDRRGDVVRSGLLELYDDGGCAIHLRDHTNERWLQTCAVHGPQRPYVVTVGDEKFSHQTRREQLAAVFEYLIEEHGLPDVESLPYESEENDFAVVADLSAAGADSLRQPWELGNGWFLEAGVGKSTARRELDRAAGSADLHVEFDGLWRQVER